MEKAYFAGGCFWCITPTFRQLDGVHQVISGYSGGLEENPTYEDVKYQRTGHRECICIVYDEMRIAYETLLQIFFDSVDLFDGGGQYIDRGFSYTLAVYYGREAQREAALRLLQRAELRVGRPTFVAVEPFRAFYVAEEYHQNYDLKNPEEFQKELETSGRLEKKLQGE